MSIFMERWELDMKGFHENSRHVRYKETCDVILIPSKEEYIESGIQLWYTSRDFRAAKYEASKEIKGLLDIIPQLSFSSAMTLLYQPSHECNSVAKKGAKKTSAQELDFSPLVDLMENIVEMNSGTPLKWAEHDLLDEIPKDVVTLGRTDSASVE